MKKNFSNPEPKKPTGPSYWRSLDEVAKTPGFQEYLDREFPEGASVLEGVDRRHFIKIMAASFALAGVGLSGCRRPARQILPFGKQPEQQIPGKPVYYATSMPTRGSALPLLVETHQGRPTKIEGNPSYALSKGKTDTVAQASVLNLYDPDRATVHTSNGETVSREAVEKLFDEIAAKYQGNGGAGLAFLAEESSSLTRRRLVEELKSRFPQAIWSEYEPIDDAAADRAATALLGEPARAFYHPGKADRILSIDADFFAVGGGAPLYYAQSFAEGRRVGKPEEGMSRLYAVESDYSLSGGMADHRLRLSTVFMPAFVARLAAEVLEGLGTGGELVQNLRSLSASLEQSDAWKDHQAESWIRECAQDLVANKGKSLIVAGTHLPVEVQALVLGLNQALEGVGETVEFLKIDPSQASSISELANAIRSDKVESLIIFGGNPVYNAPSDLDWPALQQKVGEVVRYGYYVDETSEHADHHIAATHYLESWSDARTHEGLVVAVQPMIEPLFDGINELELLAIFSNQEKREAYELVRQTIAGIVGEGDLIFQEFLHDGFVKESEFERIDASFAPDDIQALISKTNIEASAPTIENLEVRFVRDSLLDDGRYANNGWLQECPDPVTKLTWDNAVIISPRLANELGITNQDGTVPIVRKNPNHVKLGRQISPVVKLTVDGRTIEGPVHIQPGLANYTVLLPLGYGRTMGGRVANGPGFNAYPLRTVENSSIVTGVKIEVTGKTAQLANPQEHWSMEGRSIVREANFATFQENPAFAHEMGMEAHAPPNLGNARDLPLQEILTKRPQGMSLYGHPENTSVNQWGMVIDLNTCTGCSACVVACQSENNIPIVGKDQVLRGREMHWMRLDRYFASGEEDNSVVAEDPQMVTQPMLCQHCDNAPCEVVCPVAATVQDDQGLNVMVYNRCIGTRYCANNCPYKVRRFNFFDWNERDLDKLYQGPLGPKGMAETLKMQKNPNVTVRMRGVMEKCTFCIQRITEAKVAQKVKAGASDDVMVPDGAFETACQQACPSKSIVFGNIMDPESKVAKLKEDGRSYDVLGYLNTRPRISYLARVRNPNSRMPDYNSLPLTTVEYTRQNYPQNGNGTINNGGAH